MKLLKRNSLIVGGVTLLLALALLIAAALLPRPLQSQRQAERWAGESDRRFRQLTCVLAPGEALELDAIYGFRNTAMTKISAADVETTEGAAAFCDAWSAGGTVKVTGPRGSFDAAALAVGGRFFDFHPMPVLSGGYLTESDLMRDRVVLDEQLAWMLYGSSDLAGQLVTIGDTEFFVAGVVAQPKDRLTRAAGDLAPTIYLSYDNRALLGGSGVTAYEIVLPEPVKGFAKGIAEEGFGKRGQVIENTDRFSFAASLRHIRALSRLGTRTSSVIYPSWENAAVIAETWCAMARGAALLLLIWPAVLLIAALRQLLRFGVKKLKRGGRAAKEALLDRRDAHRMHIISRKGSHSR